MQRVVIRSRGRKRRKDRGTSIRVSETDKVEFFVWDERKTMKCLRYERRRRRRRKERRKTKVMTISFITIVRRREDIKEDASIIRGGERMNV